LTHSAISLPQHAEIKQICMPANAADYAQALYATLRAQDQNQYQCIFVETVPDDAEWDAIRDRLTKACSSLSSDNLR
jgi:L-threonylcarbamoyladenylate synthase